jgi:hypothetical protein
LIKQTTSQITGRAGERWFQSILPKQWIFQKPEEDIGLDGKIILGTNNSIGGHEFGVQIKTSNNWQVNKDIISVRGIKPDTILYWGSRLFPTLLVIYDERKNEGYYRWVFNILDHSYDLSMPYTQRTDRLNIIEVSTNDILNKDAFVKIQEDVDGYYDKLTASLVAFRKSINLVPIINRLIEAQRGIFIAWTDKTNNDQKQRANLVLYVVCCREIITVLDDLQNLFKLKVGSDNFFERFKKFYLSEMSKIIHEFDKQHAATVLMMNPDNFNGRTHLILDFIFDFILILTDGIKKERGFSFFEEPYNARK